MSSWRCALALAVLASGCATAAKPRVVDLQPARQALEEARAEGAPERAPETFTRAEGELQKAEKLVAESRADAPLAALEAEWAARLALSEARCAARDATASGRAPTADEVRRLEVRARRSEDEQRRLEEQIALRQRELEFTQTELIRTKARLKGLETRADASSAIAEARILVERAKSRGRVAAAQAATSSLKDAEEQLNLQNFGAALFLAMRAQDVVAKTSEGPHPAPVPEDASGADASAPQAAYEVVVDSANVRQAPSTDSPVVGEVKRGAKVEALGLRGGWVRIKSGAVTGWVSLKLLQ